MIIMAIEQDRVSSLLDSLPAVFQDDRSGAAPNFLGRFLLGFEHILLGVGDATQPGLEETISRLYRYFEPSAVLAEGERAPKDFLPWLAGWIALTLRDDWDEQRQRDLIAKAVPLYRMRGTKRGIEEFVRIYSRLSVSVDEFATSFQVGVHSRVGTNTRLDGGPPFYFHVKVAVPNAGDRDAQRAVISAVLDLQKPAHTRYTLDVDTPTFQINVNSTVGIDTLLG
jgi:phage tail-like protein